MFPLILASLTCSVAIKQDLDPTRIAEIRAMVPEGRTGLGRPVSDRAAWATVAAKPGFEGLLARAEALLGQPIPEAADELYLEFSQNGNRTRYQNAEGVRRNMLTTLTLAECVEDRGRFLPLLEELIGGLSAEKSWVLPAHDGRLANFKGETVDIDLASSALGWSLATTDWLLAERMSPQTRALIAEQLEHRVLGPFRAMVKGERSELWWMRGTNNWNSVCLAGVLGTALAGLESPDERAWFLAAAEFYAQFGLRGYTADGYCSEGVGYWNYGFGNFAMMVETALQATGGQLDGWAVEAARRPALYGPRVRILGDVCPAFADCSVTAAPSGRYLRYLNARLGLGFAEWTGEDPGSSSGSLPECVLFSFATTADSAPAVGAPAWEPRTWFPEAAVLICRPLTPDGSTFGVAMKGGHNAENHNHNDLGSWVAVSGGVPVLLDPGSETYTARTFSTRRYESKLLNSWGHPVPVVGGKLQLPGRSQEAKILATEFSDVADTFRMDIRSAYDVAALTRLERTFTYSREGAGSLTVLDEAEFTAPTAFGTALLTLGEWREVAPGVLEVTDRDAGVRVEIAVEGGEWRLSSERIEEDAPVKPTRIGIDLVAPAERCSIRVTVTPFS